MAEGRDPWRTASRAPAVAVSGLAVLLAVAGAAMVAATRPTLGTDALFLLVDATVALVYGATATLILTRSRHVVGYLLALTALGGGLSAAGGGWRVLAESRGLEAGPLSGAFGWAWVPGTLALFLVVPWLVRERPSAAPWWGPAVGALVAATALVASLTARYGLLTAALASAVVWGLVTAVAVERRRRRSSPADAVGLDWLALGTLVLALSFVPLLLPPGLAPAWLTPVLHLASQALFPAAVLAVVLRQRLWGVEVAISRALLAAALTVALAGAYLLVSVLVSRVVPGEGWAQTVAAAVVVVGVQPSRLWLERRVHRLVYGIGGDPARAAGRLGSEIGRAADPEVLLARLADQVASALRLESVTVLDADGEPLARAGMATSAPMCVGLVALDRRVGVLQATARPGERLDPRTRYALEEMAGVVATALLVGRTGQELRTTRERLTRARLEERRVLRRELHDGLGPWLAGLRLGVTGAANLVATDPAAARSMLEALQGELDQRVEEVRSAARHLLPPVLEELGLEAALRELVTRHAEGGFQVRLSYDVPAQLSEHVATAAYGIASEAVLNAARHSGESSCDLEVSADATTLRLLCRDRGVGRDPGTPSGVGTLTMHERAAELGGTLRILPLVPAGTAVEVVLPLAAEPLEDG